MFNRYMFEKDRLSHICSTRLLFSSMQLFSILRLLFVAEIARARFLSPLNIPARSVQTFNRVGFLEGIPLSMIPAQLSAAQVTSDAIDRAPWTVTCDSEQVGNECTKAIDGDPNTFWQTDSSPEGAPLPHSITIDLKASILVGNITIQPRQDESNDGHIGQHIVTLRSVLITRMPLKP